MLETFHRAKEFGIIAGDAHADFPAMIQRSRGIADKVSKGVGFLFKKNKITHVIGTATLLPRPARGSRTSSRSKGASGRSVIETKHVILATGARAKSLPGIVLDGERIIEYRKAMTLPVQPKSLVVLGAGAIGVEFASFYRALGVEVTIVEFLPQILPVGGCRDRAACAQTLRKAGHRILSSAKVTS